MRKMVRCVGAPSVCVMLASLQADAHARYVEAPLAEKVSRTSVIAVVRITDILEQKPPGRYARSAHAEVILPLKGASTAERLTVDFDTGLSCPNALYSEGATYLVFLSKQKSGRLDTFNYEYGKYLVESEVVRRWTVRRYSHRDSPLRAAISMIHNALAGRKTPT